MRNVKLLLIIGILVVSTFFGDLCISNGFQKGHSLPTGSFQIYSAGSWNPKKHNVKWTGGDLNP